MRIPRKAAAAVAALAAAGTLSLVSADMASAGTRVTSAPLDAGTDGTRVTGAPEGTDGTRVTGTRVTNDREY